MPDLSVYQRQKTLADYMRANEQDALAKQLQGAQIAKLLQLDVDQMAQQAFVKAAQGLPLSPQERGAMQYADAKASLTQFNPITGDRTNKDSISSRMGLPQAPQYTGAPVIPQMLPQFNPGLPAPSFVEGQPRNAPPSISGDLVTTGPLGAGNPAANQWFPGYNTAGMSTKTRQAVEQEEALKRAEAARTLPKGTTQAEDLIMQVEALKNHPGMKPTVGMPSWSTVLTSANPLRESDPITGIKKPFSGTAAADFNARLGQVKGAAFMEAYKTLKGGGQITEVEGLKATQALTRMNAAQSEAEFIAAADEFITQTRRGVELSRQAAGQPATSAPSLSPSSGTWSVKRIK